MDTLTTPTNLKKERILVLGFQENLLGLFSSSPEAYESFAYSEFNNAFKTLQWLEQQAKLGAGEMPHGIICNLEFLKENNFHLLEAIQNNSALKNIPFIAIASNNKEVDTLDLLKRGVDDCYTFPFNWVDLRKRIAFLHRYKAEIIANTMAEEVEANAMPVAKRLFDIAFATGVILALSPILLLIAVLIKLESKGPIIYKSKRVGNGYEVFNFLKFRSMCQGADAKLKDLAHLNQYDQDKDNGPSFVKLQNDPRVTRIGKLIRKTSLDELPQLFNVLKGDMSIVGNRPLPLYEAEQLTKDTWAKRFLAPAGITGLWQVSKRGKSDMSTEERIQLDITYADNYSFWYDVKILAKTIPAMIQEEAV